ncbi:hypothetical protein [Sphingomonas swuensis]
MASAQGSPARQAQPDTFDNRIRERDFFEHSLQADRGFSARSYATALTFAGCANGLQPAAVAAVLQTPAASREEEAAVQRLVSQVRACGRREGVHPALLRGALAEVSWKATAPAASAAPAEISIDDVESFIKRGPAGEARIKVNNLPIASVARCQVLALPAAAREVLATPAGSPQEQAAAARLYGGSRLCGGVEGLGKTPVVAIRAALADAFYQQSKATGRP